jgi:hypothetical protein
MAAADLVSCHWVSNKYREKYSNVISYLAEQKLFKTSNQIQ